jgi:undecaprenyl-diphosphatase
MLMRALLWSRDHPRLGRSARALLDPHHPEFATLATMAFILLIAAAVLFPLTVHISGQSGKGSLDQAVLGLTQNMRTPATDSVFVTITQLADGQVIYPLVAILALFLLWRRHHLAAGHLLAATVFATVATFALKALVHSPRPFDLFYNGTSIFSFPSGHTTGSVTLFGFMAVIVAQALKPERRWIAYAVAGFFAALVAFSRVYLGAHWFTDVAGGFALGAIWVAILGIAYRRRTTRPVAAKPFLLVSILALGGFWGINLALNHTEQLAGYSPAPRELRVLSSDWWENGWRVMPAHRDDLTGHLEQPLTLQWAGRLADIKQHLQAQQWYTGPSLTLSTAMLWLSPTSTIEQLPVLPHIHNNRHPALSMTAPGQNEGQRRVLRLWKTNIYLSDLDVPLWIGNIVHEHVMDLPLANVSDTVGVDTAALQQLETLPGYQGRRVKRALTQVEPGEWDGTVLLLK